MNRLAESFNIFRSLKGGQKFVIIRIFVSISVMAFIFGHRLWSSDAVVSLIIAATVLGMELCFITWLGQMRGRSYHQVTLDQAGFQLKPVKVWPSYVGRFVLAFAFFGIVAGAASSFDEASDAVTYLRVPIYVVQTLLLGLSLLQGLRFGWHAVVASEGAGAAAMTTPQVMPADAAGLTSPSTATAAAPSSPMHRIQSNRTSRWLQVIFGSVSVIATFAAIAIYVHGQQVSTDSAKDAQDPDPLTKALSEPYTLQNQGAAQPPTPTAPQTAAQSEPATSPAPALAQATPTLTSETYGNRVASFFPGESAEDALMDGLSKINSELSVDSIDPLGYPAYSLECEKNEQCVNGTGTPFGSTGDNAKEMFPVNPADIQQYGLKCDVICYDSQGRIIGRDPSFHG